MFNSISLNSVTYAVHCGKTTSGFWLLIPDLNMSSDPINTSYIAIIYSRSCCTSCIHEKLTRFICTCRSPYYKNWEKNDNGRWCANLLASFILSKTKEQPTLISFLELLISWPNLQSAWWLGKIGKEPTSISSTDWALLAPANTWGFFADPSYFVV